MLLQLLNPFVPHMTEELWQQMGHTDTLAYHELSLIHILPPTTKS